MTIEELDIAAVTKRSIHGVFALVSRTFVLQLIGFGATIILPIYLTPSVYGVYYIVTAVIAFLSYFSDIGLAAALIQKKEPLTQEDLQTTFTIQQILVGSTVFIALILSGYVGRFYHLDSAGVLLFQALVLSFFFSSLKTIPSILLERSLHFEKLVIPTIVETLAFYVVALVLAVRGFGIASFTYAVLARAVLGLITIYIIQPWRIRLGITKTVAKKLLSFGIPFQTNSFLALFKDDLLVAYIGKVLPLSQVGYIGFSQRWAYTPLRLIMDNIVRITFPSFSRLQHETAHLSRAIEKTLFALALLIFPSLVGLVTLAPLFIHILPKYTRWEPALISLGLFAVDAGVAAISSPLTNVLNATGRIKVTLYLMVFWTIMTWVLTPLCILFFGFNGVAGASVILDISVVAVVYLTRRYIPFSLKPLLTPFIAALIMAVYLVGVSRMVPPTIPSIILLIVTGGVIYMGSAFLMARKEVLSDLLLIKKQFIH